MAPSISENAKVYTDLFGLWFSSIMKNPIAWSIFIIFLIILNTLGWYYRYALFGDAFNKRSSSIFGSIGDLGGIILFRVFEYICIFGFIFYIYKYGK